MSEEFKQLPDGWVVKKLGEVINIVTGKLNANKAEDNGLYPFFTCAPTPYRINEFNFDCNAVLLAGNNANGTFHVSKYHGKFNAYQRTYVITTNQENDIDFIYYKLKNIISDFVGTSQGSATKFLTKPLIENKLIEIPPLEKQKEIAAVLSALDDKIEVNQQINKKLEEMAQAIFKQWFIDFNFPDENGNPYKDSGGAMIDSELGQIPAGWTIGNLGKNINIAGGATPSTKNDKFWINGTIYWSTPKDLSVNKDIFLKDTLKKITADGLKEITSGLLPPQTLLLSSRAPIGYLAITNINLAINQGYIAILPTSKFNTLFIYIWLKNNIASVIAMANGSTFQEISKKSFKLIQILNYPIPIIHKYLEFAEPFFQEINNLETEICKLKTIRDKLLPKLMSAEIITC